MSVIIFPPSPSINEVFSPSGSAASYIWTGTYWELQSVTNPIFPVNTSGSVLQVSTAGNIGYNTKLKLSGSTLTMTGNVVATSFTGSLRGTSSFALTASYVSGAVNINTGSLLTTASFNTYTGSSDSTFAGTAATASYVELAQTASYVELANTASYVELAQTASYVELAQTASYYAGSVTSASYADTASYVVNALTASFVTLAQTASFVQTARTASFVNLAQTASFVQTAQTASFVTLAQTASFVTLAQSSSYVNVTGSGVTVNYGPDGTIQLTGSSNVNLSAYLSSSWTGSTTSTFAGTASLASTASYVLNAVSSSRAQTASLATSASLADTASYVLNAVSSSRAVTASFALNGGVTSIVAGTNITISPASGTGAVTINSSGGGGGSTTPVYIADLAPTGSTVTTGSLWFNSNNAGLYIRYQDIDSTQWVGVSAVGAVGTASFAATANTANNLNKNVMFATITAPQTVQTNGYVSWNSASYTYGTGVTLSGGYISINTAGIYLIEAGLNYVASSSAAFTTVVQLANSAGGVYTATQYFGQSNASSADTDRTIKVVRAMPAGTLLSLRLRSNATVGNFTGDFSPSSMPYFYVEQLI